MKNIFILPTDKPSRLYEGVNKELKFTDHLITGKRILCQNIYITSDEEIREGTWCLGKENYLTKNWNALEGFEEDYKKIILTTDTDLIKDGVQAISDEFLEWFVKNPSYEEVEIEDVYKTFLEGNKRSVSNFRNRYKIIIPKEEPCTCTDECLSYLTKTCKRIEEEPKQETLEEAAENNLTYWKGFSGIGLPNAINSDRIKKSFKAGAKWQQERSYSEEDMLEFGEWMKVLPLTISGFVVKTKTKSIVVEKTKDLLQIWFEQFKKK